MVDTTEVYVTLGFEWQCRRQERVFLAISPLAVFSLVQTILILNEKYNVANSLKYHILHSFTTVSMFGILFYILISDTEGWDYIFIFTPHSGHNLENTVLIFLEKLPGDIFDVLLGFGICLYKHRKCCKISSSVSTLYAFLNAHLKVSTKLTLCPWI